MKFRNVMMSAAVAVGLCGTAVAAMASNDPTMVGGAAMYPSKNIVQNAVNSKDHTTLVAAVKAAGLVHALAGKGPFTVFAPTNEAFDMLPKGTVQTLLAKKNKQELTSILLYHVVPGDFTFATLSADVRSHGGMVKLPTLDKGHDLTFRMNGSHNIEIVDGKGGVTQIETYDVTQSNGVVQVIDHVLMP